MSTDLAILSALTRVAQQDLRYFELSTLKTAGRQRKCYCAVGKHAIFFVSKCCSKLIKGGEIFF